jgi:hypothetical protein
VVLSLILLAGVTALLGLPPRPSLPLGAVDAHAATSFIVDGLRLLVTIGVWYLLTTATLAAGSMVPGLAVVVRPAARRVTDAGLGAILRRVVATSAVVGVSLPGTAAAGAPAPGDEPPVMTPIDPSEGGAPGEGSPGGAEDPPDATGDIVTEGRPRTGPADASRPPGPHTASTSSADRAESAAEPPTDGPSPGRGAAGSSPVMQRVEPPRETGVADGDVPGRGDAPVMDHRAGTSPAVGAEETTDAADERSARSETSAPRGATPATRHVVRRGESFWTIAAGLAGEGTAGRPAGIDEIAPLWQQLVDQNADILVEPGNPDLLHPGQVVDMRGLDE